MPAVTDPNLTDWVIMTQNDDCQDIQEDTFNVS